MWARRLPRSRQHRSPALPGRRSLSWPWPPPPGTTSAAWPGRLVPSAAGSGVRRRGGPRSERQRLRPAVHFGAPVLGHRLDRRARQRVIGREQPAQRLRLVEAAVEEHGQRPVQALEDVVAVQEGGGYAHRAVRALDRDQPVVAEQLPDPAGRKAEPGGYLGEGEPITDKGVGPRVNLCHISECPTADGGANTGPPQVTARAASRTATAGSASRAGSTAPPAAITRRPCTRSFGWPTVSSATSRSWRVSPASQQAAQRAPAG